MIDLLWLCPLHCTVYIAQTCIDQSGNSSQGTLPHEAQHSVRSREQRPCLLQNQCTPRDTQDNIAPACSSCHDWPCAGAATRAAPLPVAPLSQPASPQTCACRLGRHCYGVDDLPSLLQTDAAIECGVQLALVLLHAFHVMIGHAQALLSAQCLSPHPPLSPPASVQTCTQRRACQ